MTDIRLLEAAARAAGLPWDQWVEDGNARWNPLEDDGDALRLAVKLGLEIRQVHYAAHAGHPNFFWETETYGDDPSAATRRAIVRAAARRATLAGRMDGEKAP